jgi:predicted DNA-binding transcriptional regulator AlpA
MSVASTELSLQADRVVSMPEASTLTGLSIDTLKRCGARNELKILKLSPRRIGIRLSDIQAFVSRG